MSSDWGVSAWAIGASANGSSNEPKIQKSFMGFVEGRWLNHITYSIFKNKHLFKTSLKRNWRESKK
jgi:hypothetical protein